MKSRQDICWQMEWCSVCHNEDERNPCFGLEIPDYIPDDQILKFIREKKLLKSTL